jgi:hypothetical protein
MKIDSACVVENIMPVVFMSVNRLHYYAIMLTVYIVVIYLMC